MAGHVMADEKQCLCGYKLAQEAHAFLCEVGISYGKGLVYDKDIRIYMGNDGKCQAHDHAAGVIAYRLVDEIADICKGHDVVIAGPDLRIAQSQDGCVQKHVLAPCEFRVEAAAQLQQSGDPSARPDTACRGGQSPGDDLQKSALAGRHCAPRYRHILLYGW